MIIERQQKVRFLHEESVTGDCCGKKRGRASTGRDERDVLKKLQHRTPFLRLMVDEFEEPSLPTTIVSGYLESDLLEETIKKALNRKELKYTCRRVLEALKVIHEHYLVHTGTYTLLYHA